MTEPDWGERVADYQDALGDSVAEARALFAGARWVDMHQPLPQDRAPDERPVLSEGLTIVAARQDYSLWCVCVDEHLARWEDVGDGPPPPSLREAMSGIEGP